MLVRRLALVSFVAVALSGCGELTVASAVVDGGEGAVDLDGGADARWMELADLVETAQEIAGTWVDVQRGGGPPSGELTLELKYDRGTSGTYHFQCIGQCDPTPFGSGNSYGNYKLAAFDDEGNALGIFWTKNFSMNFSVSSGSPSSRKLTLPFPFLTFERDTSKPRP